MRTYGPMVGPGPHAERRPHRPRWHESLNLTLEQRREMRRIELAMFREARQCRQDVNTN
ncbi:MAG: hypothetical protein SYC29_07740 [Planctomycetota bacterium]|nr:hypothetical protein [Planctomycetota bacterium]